MAAYFVVFVLALIYAQVNAVVYQCRDSSAANYVIASQIKCDLDLRAQCGCGTWCGIGGSTFTEDTEPKCVPRVDTPDAPPPVSQGGNPCALSNCPFSTFSLVKCPAGSLSYLYVGASCNKLSSGACVWQLPYCPEVFPPNYARYTKCTNKPTSPPAGQSATCSGAWFKEFTPYYECVSDGTGGWRWEWVPCVDGNACPYGMEDYTGLCDPSTVCYYQSPACTTCPALPSQCGNLNDVNLLRDYCGGCNCHITSKATGAALCDAQTWKKPYDTPTSEGIDCKTGYTYQSTYPYCVPSTDNTCASKQCDSASQCYEILTKLSSGHTIFVPTCAPKSGIFDPSKASCADVGCRTGFKCQSNSDGTWSCVTDTSKTCSASDCTTAMKTLCWDGSRVGSGCSLSKNGNCEWGYVPCPNYTVPATTGSVKNCQVGAWTSWSCGAPCGQWTKQTRTRQITQQPDTNGQACPALLETGADCQNNSPSCASIPPGTDVGSEFTSGTPSTPGTGPSGSGSSLIIPSSLLIILLALLFVGPFLQK